MIIMLMAVVVFSLAAWFFVNIWIRSSNNTIERLGIAIQVSHSVICFVNANVRQQCCGIYRRSVCRENKQTNWLLTRIITRKSKEISPKHLMIFVCFFVCATCMNKCNRPKHLTESIMSNWSIYWHFHYLFLLQVSDFAY